MGGGPTIVDYPRMAPLRVRSSEAFGRRPNTGSTARAWPASETLPDSGHLGNHDRAGDWTLGGLCAIDALLAPEVQKRGALPLLLLNMLKSTLPGEAALRS